ncbi:MAG: glycosyltransferase [Lachnospiraceae bacterium]|nr:glycosyltransferase [Lachnospiraceae bacterium]
MEKVIHYFWFGRKEKPEIVKKCMSSWQDKMPGWKMIEWNEDNFDVNSIPYTAEAYEAGKYAFVSDYARCKVLYEQGGVYLDTDVEVLKPLDELVENHKGFMGFELDETVAPGLITGTEKGNVIMRDMCRIYESIHYKLENGKYNNTTVVEYATRVLVQHGLQLNGQKQIVEDITIFPREYFAPYNIYTERMEITDHTYSIHHYTATWQGGWLKLRFRIKKQCKMIVGPQLTKKIISLKRKIKGVKG